MVARQRRKRSRNKANATGRSTYVRHIQFAYRLLESPAYRSLTVNARALLTELSMLFNGENNGSLYLSVRDAAARLGLASTKTAQIAFDELEAIGFITMTRDAHFSVKAGEHSRARAWRLNWLPGPGNRLPDLDLCERQPEPQTKPRKRMERGLRALKAYKRRNQTGNFPVVDSDTLGTGSGPSTIEAIAESDTAKTQNCGSGDVPVVSDSATNIYHHGGPGDHSRQNPAGRPSKWLKPIRGPKIDPWWQASNDACPTRMALAKLRSAAAPGGMADSRAAA